MEEQAIQEEIQEIEYIASDELQVGAIGRYIQELPDTLIRLGVRVLLALVVFFVGVQLIKLIRRILRKSFERHNVDVGVSRFMDSFVKAVLYILLLFMIASSFGLDATSVVALVGSAGVAIGLAVQGSLANGSILNMSTVNDRRMDIKVGISYDADIRRAKEVLLKVLEEDPGVLQEQEKLVYVDELADNSVVLSLRCYSANEMFWETKWRLTEKAKYALDEAGISIPFPQLDVHMR